MIFEKFSKSPSSRSLKILIIIGFILCVVVIPVMQYYTEISGFPAEIFSSQLSFNGDIMKAYYAVTDVDLYRVAPSLDYIFMVGYGTILFSLSVLIARKYGLATSIGNISFLIAIFGVIAAVCDGIENIFILSMLADSTGFPNLFAISHSVFALIKWILLFVSITWVIIAGILSLIKGKNKLK